MHELWRLCLLRSLPFPTIICFENVVQWSTVEAVIFFRYWALGSNFISPGLHTTVLPSHLSSLLWHCMGWHPRDPCPLCAPMLCADKAKNRINQKAGAAKQKKERHGEKSPPSSISQHFDRELLDPRTQRQSISVILCCAGWGVLLHQL